MSDLNDRDEPRDSYSHVNFKKSLYKKEGQNGHPLSQDIKPRVQTAPNYGRRLVKEAKTKRSNSREVLADSNRPYR